GLEERLNWLHLARFISESLPRPDGSNLASDAAKANYLDKGKRAYQKLVLHNAGKETLTPAEFDNVRKDLIQFNIEEFDCLYCEDLSALQGKVNALNLAKESIRTSLPGEAKLEGKGWVVELRGYTDHALADRFVLEALVDNLVNTPVQGQAAPQAKADE